MGKFKENDKLNKFNKNNNIIKTSFKKNNQFLKKEEKYHKLFENFFLESSLNNSKGFFNKKQNL